MLHKDCITFRIKGKTIDFYSEEIDYGLNTVAEYDGRYHYLGGRLADIITAIEVWELNNNKLGEEEVSEIIQQNKGAQNESKKEDSGSKEAI